MTDQMASTTDELFAEQNSEGFGITGLVAVLVFLGVAAWAAILWTQKAEQTNTLFTLQGQIEEVQETMASIQTDKNISDELSAATILRTVEKSRTEWSKLVTELNELETDTVRFTSWSVNRKSQVFVTGQAPSYTMVAGVVETVRGTPQLASQFVESIVQVRQSTRSRTGLDPAEPSVQFQLVFDYGTEMNNNAS